MSDATFEIGHLSQRIIGKKIREHFRDKLSEGPERETFLAKIRSEGERSSVSDRLTGVLFSDSDCEFVAGAFDRALRNPA